MPSKKTFHVTNRNEAFAYLAFRAAQAALGTNVENAPAPVRRYHARLEQESIRILKSWDANMIAHWIADMRNNEPKSEIPVSPKCIGSYVETPEWEPEKFISKSST